MAKYLFELHQKWCIFLSCQLSKKTTFLVQLKQNLALLILLELYLVEFDHQRFYLVKETCKPHWASMLMSKRSSFLSKYDKKIGFIIVKKGFKYFFVQSNTLFISTKTLIWGIFFGQILLMILHVKYYYDSF